MKRSAENGVGSTFSQGWDLEPYYSKHFLDKMITQRKEGYYSNAMKILKEMHIFQGTQPKESAAQSIQNMVG